MRKILFIIILFGSLFGSLSAQSKIKSNLTIEKVAPMLYLNGTSAGIDFYNGDITLQQSSNTLTLSGGDLALGTNSITMTGALGATGGRILKGWFTDLEVTNVITGTVGSVTGFTRNSGTLTLSGGHGLTFTTLGTTSLTLPTSGTLAINPMTTAGDLVIGGTSGAPTRLAAGTDGYTLTMIGGAPAWGVPGGGGGAMIYPLAGIPISTGTSWGTSITNNSVEWDSAYVARLRWSGTATGLTASTGRTSLGGTTIGQSMFTLSNPSAITFPRFNADNTVSALTAANFKTAISLTATDVGLGNVTNESKVTMFSSPTFTTQVTLPATTYMPFGGVFSFNTGDITLTHSLNTLTFDGGDLALGANNLAMTGSIGATGSRVLKGWFTDLEVTNAIAGSITGNAATVTGFTRNAGTLTLSGGHGITATTTATTAVTLPTTGTLATLTNINDSLTARIGAGVELSDVAIMIADSTGNEVGNYMSRQQTAALVSDTIVARLSAAVEGIRLVDSTGNAAGNYMPRLQTANLVNDTITARIAAATVGVAAVDSNIYAGYTTRTYVESLLGSGSGLSAQRLPFIVGVTTGAPAAADSTVAHSEFAGKHIDLYRDGAKQYQQFTATNIYKGFRISGSTITVNPAWQANEQVLVDIIQPILWSYLSLEGQESSLLDSLRGYWKLDETSGTTVTDAAGIQNGTRTAGVTVGVAGKLGYANTFDTSGDVINIPYNTNVSPKGADFSFAAWIKLDSLPSVVGHDCYVFQQNIGADPYSAHYVYVDDADNKLFATSRNTSGTAYQVRSTTALSVGTWYHVVFVNPGNGQDLELYVNGTEEAASAVTFSGTLYEGLSTTCFGNGYQGSTGFFVGTIDSPALWGVALTSGQVTTLYNSGSGKSHPFN